MSKIERFKEMQEEEGNDNAGVIKSLQEELGILLEQEDIKWRQRTKRNWISLVRRIQYTSLPMQTKEEERIE